MSEQAMSEALVNGKSASTVALSERGLHYGDGLFETISCVEARPRWLPLHLERLHRGLSRLHIAFDAFAALEDEIHRLAGVSQERCLVKVIVTRGVATARGYAPAGNETPTRIVSRYEWPAAPELEFRAGVSEIRMGLNPLLAGVKHLNRLEQVLARRACVRSGLSEVLMLSATQQVIGGSMSNVFFATEQGLLTPELADCGVEGVMRRVVLQSAAALGMPVAIRAVSVEEVAHMREVFFTNVRWGVQSARWLDGRELPSDECAQRLRRQIDAHTR